MRPQPFVFRQSRVKCWAHREAESPGVPCDSPVVGWSHHVRAKTGESPITHRRADTHTAQAGGLTSSKSEELACGLESAGRYWRKDPGKAAVKLNVFFEMSAG